MALTRSSFVILLCIGIMLAITYVAVTLTKSGDRVTVSSQTFEPEACEQRRIQAASRYGFTLDFLAYSVDINPPLRIPLLLNSVSLVRFQMQWTNASASAAVPGITEYYTLWFQVHGCNASGANSGNMIVAWQLPSGQHSLAYSPNQWSVTDGTILSILGPCSEDAAYWHDPAYTIQGNRVFYNSTLLADGEQLLTLANAAVSDDERPFNCERVISLSRLNVFLIGVSIISTANMLHTLLTKCRNKWRKHWLASQTSESSRPTEMQPLD